MGVSTRILQVDPQHPAEEIIELAAQDILSGKLVAFPTETVYGLGANALDEEAVRRIFRAKGRPAEDPLIVHLSSVRELPRVARAIPALAWDLGERFWPGALTLVLPKTPQVPLAITAGLDTVAVRVPAHAVALALLRKSGVPIAAPSANRFGHTSPTTAQHVWDDLQGEVELILDGGATTIGVESTVLDLTQHPPVVLRPGGVTVEELRAHIGMVQVRQAFLSPASGRPQVSPGMLEKHYAPRARLVYVHLAEAAASLEAMRRSARQFLEEGLKVGVLILEEERGYFEDLPLRIYSLGLGADEKEAAARLYAGLRALDQEGVAVILARDLGEQGMGLAIRDRLRRAASEVVE